MFEQLSQAIAEKSEIIAPDHRYGGKDLGVRTELETRRERFQFELALLCVAVKKLKLDGPDEPWLQSWRPEVRAALESVPELDDNPLVVAARETGLWVPNGLDLRDRQLDKAPGKDYDPRKFRYLGFAAEYISQKDRKRADQLPHIDGVQPRPFERKYSQVVGMRSFRTNNKGTYVGHRQDMLTATKNVLEGNRVLLERSFPVAHSGRVAVNYARRLDGDFMWHEKDHASRVIRRFIGVSMREFKGLKLHARRYLLRKLLDQVFEQAETPIVHLKLPPGTWAFLDETQVAHGRYDARGDLLALNL